MRKKWGMILGLTGMMLLGSQGVYAAETADSTAETEAAEAEKDEETVETTENTEAESSAEETKTESAQRQPMTQTISRARLKKAASPPELPCMTRPSSRTTAPTTSSVPIWNLRNPLI
ncbi:hypothetical protein DW049_17545 [Ruminococcus sp. AF41-9]|nr:hypothetical protein DW049_17545 [Ruminococcus sp. AF41-9]